MRIGWKQLNHITSNCLSGAPPLHKAALLIQAAEMPRPKLIHLDAALMTVLSLLALGSCVAGLL